MPTVLGNNFRHQIAILLESHLRLSKPKKVVVRVIEKDK